jgi:AcrR family transcriptional regulator
LNVALPATVQSPAAQERARHIIEAASTAMSRQGYGNTSMKDIAAEAGVAQGLIHYYFGTKEDLLVAVVRNLNDQMLTNIKAGMAEVSGDPLTQMWTSLRVIRDEYATQSDSCRLFFDLISLSFTNERLRKEVAELYRDLTAETTAMVHRLSEDLPLAPPIPEEEFAAILLATIDGVLLRNVLEPEFGKDRLFRGLGFLWASSAAASYAWAGETPPLEVFEDILNSADTPATPSPFGQAQAGAIDPETEPS